MISLSDLDSRRFGHVTAKADIRAGDDVEGILQECADRQVRFLIARCSTQEVGKVQEMERLGFFLTDTLVYYGKEPIAARTRELPEGFATRAAAPADAAEVEALAARAFHGYSGHYHADPRLERARCDEVYASWAANACRGGEFCTHMILITSAGSGEIAGFAALKRSDDTEFDGVLFAVHPAFQGRGLFAHLLELSQHWGMAHDFQRMSYSTQLTNIHAQKTLCRHGFVPERSSYTLHKWLA
jgi:ribosomal protein S18 acetylase RimI-like enzyme